MATKSKPDSGKQIIDRVQKLVNLAQSVEDGEPTEEARTAAIQAVRLMNEHQLTVVPQVELENVQKVIAGAQAAMRKASSERTKNIAIGFGLSMLFGGKMPRL
jgi:hypothetical protein